MLFHFQKFILPHNLTFRFTFSQNKNCAAKFHFYATNYVNSTWQLSARTYLRSTWIRYGIGHSLLPTSAALFFSSLFMMSHHTASCANTAGTVVLLTWIHHYKWNVARHRIQSETHENLCNNKSERTTVTHDLHQMSMFHNSQRTSRLRNLIELCTSWPLMKALCLQCKSPYSPTVL